MLSVKIKAIHQDVEKRSEKGNARVAGPGKTVD